MALTSKRKKLNINYRPLRPSISLQVVTSVPDRQVYKAADKSYTPDYTLTPLTLFPRCGAVDPSSMTTQVAGVNSQLTNMKWYERISGVQTLISSGTDYVITQTGDQKGQIQVRKNSDITNPITLEFEADYIDTRTNQVIHYSASRVLVVSDGTEPQPVLQLDSPDTVQWYPVRDRLQQTITAAVMLGDLDFTADDRLKFFWYRVLATGALEQITDGNGDNDFEIVSVNRNVLVIDRDFIGNQQTYVCKVAYRPDGVLPDAPTDADPQKTTTIKRVIPKVECDYKGMISGCPPGTKNIYPVAYIRDTVGVIENPEEWFRFIWYAKKTSDTGYSKIAEGIDPTIPFTEGMLIELEVEDKGPQALIVDDDDQSVYITDEEGNLSYQRINEQTY